MMKEEFEALIGFKVSDEVYREIEYIYNYDDYFTSKKQIADYFLLVDYNGIHTLYRDLLVPAWDSEKRCIVMKEVRA